MDAALLRKLMIIEEANKRHEARARGVTVLDHLDLNKLPENLIIRGLRGLGDNINQRAFIKELDRPVYLDTPWPELYSDLEKVKFVKCQTPLRTQTKNLARQPVTRFVEEPTKNYAELHVSYGSRDLQQGSIFKKMSWIFGGLKPKVFDLPFFPYFSPDIPVDKPIAVIRPATVRKEWAAVSRNPKPEYLADLSQALIDEGFFVVSVADLAEGEEWILPPIPPAHVQFHKGELGVEDLIGLAYRAKCLVGGHGFITHLAASLKKQAFITLGGFGGDNPVRNVADPEFQDVSMLTFAVPDNFCLCTSMAHTICDKRISNFSGKVSEWIQQLQK